jgi:hypothetical protein
VLKFKDNPKIPLARRQQLSRRNNRSSVVSISDKRLPLSRDITGTQKMTSHVLSRPRDKSGKTKNQSNNSKNKKIKGKHDKPKKNDKSK